jgi:hypothetical protein
MVITTDTVRDIPDTLSLEFDKKNVIRVPYYAFDGRFRHKLIEDKDNSSLNSLRQRNNKYLNLKKIVLNCIQLARPIYKIPFVNRLLFEPMGWYRYATRAGLQAIKNNKIDIIYSTFPPTVDHIIAAQLHKQTGVPWIAEFRDEWSIRQPAPFYYFDKRWAKQTLKYSNLLISVTPTLVRELGSFHSKRTVLITNGFDETDYKTNNITLTPRMTITYTGTIYPGRRDPSPIFQAVAQLKIKGLISPEDMEIRFFGDNVGAYIPSFVEKFGVKDFVKIGGNIVFRESINRQMESTILLCLEWNDPKGSGIYTGKIFEYIGARKPILALGYKNGDIDKLLQETGCGVMANDVTEIESILLLWLKEFKEDKKISYYYHPNKVLIEKYTRREQTKKLVQVFDEEYSRNHLKP